MASSKLIDIGVKLGKQLGANTNKFLGTRSNINFLGKGPDEGKLFQQDINTEVLGGIELKSALPEIETSLGYLTAGKLNDIQANKLIDNLTKMNDFYYPITGDSVANVTDMASRTGGLTRGGLESLRGLGLKNLDNVEAAAAESPLMSRVADRVKNIQTQTNDASAIMETIPKNEVPGKTASAREFLLNALKEGDEVGRTTFADTIDPRDLKFLTEGGGGVDGDPIVLVQKYFGPRVAELLPSNATVDDIAIFTQRILNDATDAKGLRPTDPEFDKFTLKFADGGRAGYLRGGAAQDMGNLENQTASANAGGGATGDFSNEAQNFNHRYRDQLNNNNNNDTVGITSVIAAPPAITTVDRVRDGTISVDEEDEDKMTTAANAITNFENFNNQNQKKANIVATFARQELFADGGRAGLAFGGLTKSLLKKLNIKKIKAAVDDIFPSGDYKYDAEMAAESLVEMNPKLFGGQLYDDLDDMVRSDVYGLVLKELSQRNALKMQLRRAAVGKGVVNENVPEFKRESMKLVDGVTGKGKPFQTFETTTPPRQFKLNVEKAMSELNIPREEAERIARLSSDEQKAALDIYLNRSNAQGVQLMNYNPKKFDAAKGGLAKILEI